MVVNIALAASQLSSDAIDFRSPRKRQRLLSFGYAARNALKDCRVKVLSLSTDQELSQLRQTILEAAGNEVVSLLSEKEALATAQSSEDFDVVLLCHRFPSATARQVVRLLRQHHPDARIVYIVHVYGEWPEVEADRYIVGADGSQALVRVLEEVHA